MQVRTVEAAAAGRTRAARFVGLYPRTWRERYGEEMEAILEADGFGFRTLLDLVRGALDAHLHPVTPSPLPVLAALTASAFAVAHAIALAAQPVPTDWPGYLQDALPLIIGSVLALIPAIVGLWLKLGDTDGPIGRVGVILAVVGYVAWLAALLAAAARVAYGPLTAAAATVAMVGTAALGVALVGRSRVVLGTLLATAALAGVAPPALGWPAFAAAWTGVAVALLINFARHADGGRGRDVRDELAGLGRFAEPSVAILRSLSEGPKRGDAIMASARQLTGEPLGPGTLYATLSRLETRGLIESLPAVDRRRPYRLSPGGAAVLRAQLEGNEGVVRTGLARLGRSRRSRPSTP